jgi:hypothetical protein
MNPYVGKQKKSDDNEDTDFEKYMLQEREKLMSSQSDENKCDEEEEALPDLVDSCGNKAPSQVAEEEAARKAKSEARHPEDENPDPAELIQTEVGLVQFHYSHVNF